MRRSRLLLALIASLVPLARAQPVEVAIQDFLFFPDDVTIEAGAAVRWTNHDSTHHTATSQTGPGTLVPSGVFDSGDLEHGESFEYRFLAPGTYYYYCVPHASSMQGIIRVLPACPADFNQDGGIDGTDVESFFAAWVTGESDADVNADGGVDGEDVGTFFGAWVAGGC